MRIFLMLSLLALAGCASAPAPTVTTAPVIAAERAFASRAGEVGWIPAFREYTAPDGQIAAPVLASAPQSLAETPDDGARNLFWWPAYAGISRSGDLGFTTGPFSVDEARTPRGQYFTVWRRQADGSWKWIWDGGPGPVSDPPNIAPDAADVPSLPVASRGVGSAADAAGQVQAIENAAGSAGAIAPYLASDAHVYRGGRPRGIGPTAAENMAYPNSEVRYRLLRTEASAAGDLAFTLGEANWVREGAAREGYFMRVWQYRPEGWRIVYDQLIGRPPAPPPPAN